MSDAPAAPPRSRTGLRLAAIGVGLALAFVCAEGLLWIVGASAPPVTTQKLENLDDPTVHYHCYATNPNGEFQPVPDVSTGRWKLQKTLLPPVEIDLERLDETPWCVEHRAAATGVRGAAVTPFPMPGNIRIAGIGDSFAHGDGVPEDRTLFADLQQELGDGYEVLNCGRSGADLELGVQTLEWVATTYNPQRAIVVVLPNDVRLSDELFARQSLVFDLINIRAEHMGDGSEQPWYLRGSRVTRLLATWSAMGRVSDDTLQLYRDSFDPAINGANIDRFRAQMQRLTAFPRGSVVVVLYPLMIGFEDGYPLQSVHNGIRAMAEADGLPVLDLAPAFAGQDTESLWVHDVDHHPNGKAHAIAAKALAEWLRGDVPEFLNPR